MCKACNWGIDFPTDPAAGQPVIFGYLRRHRRTAHMRERWALCVPCQVCQLWHEHGGAIPDDVPFPVGSAHWRVPHCGADGRDVSDAYRWIVVSPEPFRPAWSTGKRRLSRAWREYAATRPVTAVAGQ